MGRILLFLGFLLLGYVPRPAAAADGPVDAPGVLRQALAAACDTADPQQPHEQDEVYIVVAGSGTFVVDGERAAFTIGDALFVPAGVEHRFEDFSEDFTAWVVFYGPPGGESP